MLLQLPRLFLSLADRGWLFFAAILVVVAGTWGFIALTDEVLEGETGHFDRIANQYFHDHPGPPWIQDAGRDVTALGGPAVLFLVMAAVIGYLLLARLHRMLLFVLVAMAGALLLTFSLKHFIDRPRPLLHQVGLVLYAKSFPSGHSVSSATLYLTLGGILARTMTRRTLKLYFIGLACALTFLVGLSRVYLGCITRRMCLPDGRWDWSGPSSVGWSRENCNGGGSWNAREKSVPCQL